MLTWKKRVNFKKNEKVYDSANSQVFKMLQEMDKEPKEEPTDEDPAELTHRAVAAHPPVKSPSAAAAQQPFIVHHPVDQQQKHYQPAVVHHHPIHQEYRELSMIIRCYSFDSSRVFTIIGLEIVF